MFIFSLSTHHQRELLPINDMELKTRPKSIEVSNNEQKISIEWADGHQSVYNLFGLRKNCPCVMCQGGHANMGQYDRSLFFVEPTFRYEVLEAKQIGNHALKIKWNDGHETGMYQWETLREICPCATCYPKQK